MSDWNPQVVAIERVETHPNADVLDIVTVLGDYPIVVKRGEYEVNDLTGYVPIDSIVPDISAFYFLCSRNVEKYEDPATGEIKTRVLGPKYELGSVPEKCRIIKAKKIRGQYSQGMLVNLNEFSQQLLQLGDSIVELIGLKKWEEPEDDENVIVAGRSRGRNAEKAPKDWSIPYYDMDGLRKYANCLLSEEEVILTEKVHGANFSAAFDGERLWVKSRNFYKKFDPDDLWWNAAIRYELESKLSQFPHLVFFGEIYGNVKGFRYDVEIVNGTLMTRLRFFDIWDTRAMKFLDYDAFKSITTQLNLDVVPELYRGPWLGRDAMYSYAEGKTTLGGKHVREGFVLRTAKERYEPRIRGRMQVKLVGEGYNLAK